MSDTAEKNYPAASEEVAKMLGIDSQDYSSGTKVEAPGHLPVSDLPVVDAHANPHVPQEAHNPKVQSQQDKQIEEDLKEADSKPALLKYAKTALPYLLVFVVGIFLYYFFFSSVNFSDLFQTHPTAQSPSESAISKLEKQGLAGYNSWIASFYYDVSDPKVLDPNADNSGNGLTNFQKYLLNLNPKSYDTLGLGRADSQDLAAGINPLTGDVLTDKQKEIISKYFDMEVISNRLALAHLNNGQVAGANTASNPSPSPVPTTVNNQQYENNPRGTNNAYVTPTVSPTAPINANEIEVDTNIPGRLEIPDLKINVPIIWSKDPKNFEDDLKIGVVHYPGTALPGQIGTTYISGHSSNYAWAAGNFNHVFTQLGDLGNNTSFKITVVQKNGRNAILNYVVTSHKEYQPTDQAQFENSGKSVVALSTCWPVGSTAKRLVVFGELTQVQK